MPKKKGNDCIEEDASERRPTIRELARHSQKWLVENEDFLRDVVEQLDRDSGKATADDGSEAVAEDDDDTHDVDKLLVFESKGTNDHWVLFRHVCEALLHATPWRPLELTVQLRKRIMDRVVAIFFDHCPEANAAAATATSSPQKQQKGKGKKQKEKPKPRAKKNGNQVQFDDAEEEDDEEADVIAKNKRTMKAILQGIRSECGERTLESLLVEYMEGNAWVYDDYRQSKNFVLDQYFADFKALCEQKVEERLRLINKTMSKADESRRRVRSAMDDIKYSTKCYGIAVTLQLREVKFDPLGAYANVSTLPRGVYATVALRCKGDTVSEQMVRTKAVSSMDRLSATWDPPAPVGLGVCKDTFADETDIVITLHGADACGLCRVNTIAQVTIPVTELYKNLWLPEAKEREKYPSFGLHLTEGHYIDRVKGYGVTTLLHLHCCDDAHNEPSPVADFRMEERKAPLPNARSKEVWKIDHHSAFMRLLDMLGELNDGEYYALKLYADRFLIHDELFMVGTVCSAAINGDFGDEETRDFALVSTKQLSTIIPTLKTQQCVALVHRTLKKVREQCVLRLCTLEDITRRPEDAPDVVRKAITMLNSCGVSVADIPNLVDERIKWTAQLRVRKFTKLRQSFQKVVDPSSRMSVLSELEDAEDKTLTGKAGVTLHLLQDIYTSLIDALTFARKSKNKQVVAFALRRADLTLNTVRPALAETYNLLTAQMVQSTNPVDPLGDTFGVLSSIFLETHNMVRYMYDYEALEDIAPSYLSIFDGFLQNWFVICRAKLGVLIRAIVDKNPLVAVNPSKRRYTNGAPSDVLHLMSSLTGFYESCAQWSDPEQAAVNLPSHCKMLAKCGEAFVFSIAAKGDGVSFQEEVVCLSTLGRFEELNNMFWTDRILNELARAASEELSQESILQNCSDLKTQCITNVRRIISKYVKTFCQNFKAWFAKLISFEQSVTTKLSEREIPHTVGQELSSHVHALLTNANPAYLGQEIAVEVVATLHDTFVDRIVALSSAPLSERESSIFNGVLHHVEDNAEHILATCELSDEQSNILQTRSRMVLRLAHLASPELASSCAQCTGSDKAYQWHLMVLTRRSDKDAQKYVKSLGVSS